MLFSVAGLDLGALTVAVILSSFFLSRDGQFCNPHKSGWLLT